MIDITGFQFDMVRDYVISRYAGESTAAERMAAESGAADPFAPIEEIRDRLEEFAAKLAEEDPDLDVAQIQSKLIQAVRRSD